MNISLPSLGPVAAYALMTQAIVPRPVAWVLTENDTGAHNLAPFSYFNLVAARPPVVMLSIGPLPDGGIKDTRYNLEARGRCVIHIAHREMAATMTASSARFGRDMSEIEGLGLRKVAFANSELPRLADCRIACSAKLFDSHMVHQQWVAYLELEELYLDDSVAGQDAKGRLKVLADKVDPIARLGGGEYLLAGDIVDIPRPA